MQEDILNSQIPFSVLVDVRMKRLFGLLKRTLPPLAHTVPGPEPWVWPGFNQYLSNAGMNHSKVTALQINFSQALPLISPLHSPLPRPGHLCSLPSPHLPRDVSRHRHAYFLNFMLQIEFSYSPSEGSASPRVQTQFPNLISSMPLAVGRLGSNPHCHTKQHGQGNLVTSAHHGGSASVPRWWWGRTAFPRASALGKV